MRSVLALVAVAWAGSPAWAQLVPDYEPLVEPIGRMMTGCLEQSYDDDSALACEDLTHRACLAMGRGADTTFGRVMCAMLLDDLWDAELNRLWSLVLDGRDAAQAERLRDEQRAWIDYRDAACRFAVAEVAGGSMAAHVGGDCRVRMTAERIVAFREILRYR